MKKLLLVGACFLTLAGAPFPTRASEPSVVVVRIVDDGGNVYMALTGPNGLQQVFEFKAQASLLNTKGFLSNLQAASKGYQSVLETLYREGYELKSTLLNPTTNLTTLILVKPG